MAIKIAIANQKGGVGKTTTAICLAQNLISLGYRVLFIDTDSQCNSSLFYEAKQEETETLADILCNDTDINLCIQHTNKGDIISSDKVLIDAETMVKVDERRFTHLKRAIKNIDSHYDFIIIDTPPVIGVLLKNVLAVADHIIIPIEESGWSLSGIMDFSNAVELAQDNNEKLNILGILTIKAKERTTKSQRIAELADSLSGKLHTRMFNNKIRESVACAEALTEYYIPLNEYAPKSTTTIDYFNFTKEVLEVLNYENKV